MTSRILSRFFALKCLSTPSAARKRSHVHVECLESRIAPASISLTSVDGRQTDFDLGSGGSYTLDVAHGKLEVFDSAHQLVWKHRAAGVLDLSIDAGADSFTLSGLVRVGDSFDLTGTGALTINGLVQAGREIHVEGGFVSVTGSLVAKKGGLGGEIVVTGDKIALLGNAKINVSGAHGGGTVRIGGGFQGGDADVQNANKVLVEPDVKIRADAVGRGVGGTVILYADGALQFAGNISAQGGALGGRGGFVETSAGAVQVLGNVQVSSAKGRQGTWLIDPNNLRVAQAADFHIVGGPGFFDTDGDDAFLSVASLEAALNAGGNVTLTTQSGGANTQDGRIEIWDTVTKSGGADSTLTFNAHTSVVFVNDGDTDAPALISTNNKLNVQINANYDGDGSGGVFFMTYDGINNISPTIDTNGGNFATNTAVGETDRAVSLDHATITTGAGDITITGQGLTGGTSNSAGIDIINNSSLTTTSGNITLVGSGASGFQFSGGIGISNGSTITTATGVISLTGTTTSTSDNAFGVKLETNSVVSATGIGTVTINGTASASAVGGENIGVNVEDGSSIIGGTTGTVTVTGLGGSGTADHQHGVQVENGSTITSNGANVQVTGTGGGTGATGFHFGVNVALGGSISAGGTGSVTVLGTGGAGGFGVNHGVFVQQGSATITSTNGNVNVIGFGGGSGTSFDDDGVVVFLDASITAGGAASTVTVTGTAGVGSGTAQAGVWIGGGAAAKITSSGGAVLVTGTGGAGPSPIGIDLNDASVSVTTATNGGNATLVADSMNIAGAVTANALGTVTLRPKTAGVAVNLGSAIDSTPATLELSAAELGLANGGLVQIGDGTSGAISISSAIAAGSNLSLITGAGVSGAGALTLAAGKNLGILANGAINFTGAVSVPGTTSLSTGANAISLTNAANDFGGAVTLSNSGANGASIRDANALTLGISNLGSGASTLTATALTVSGTITSAPGGSINVVAPTISLQAPIIHPGGALTGTGTTVSVGGVGLIQNGVDVSVAGATVAVAAGTYNEQVTIDRAITLLGANEAVDAVTGSRGSESTIDAIGGTALTVNTPGAVTIRGFSLAGDTGISSISSGALEIRNDIVTVVSGDGIAVTNAAGGVLIQGNDIDANNNAGILASGVAAVTITGNAITNALGTGVVVDGTTNPTAVTFGAGNTVSGGDTGLTLSGALLSVVGNNLAGLAFTGQTGHYITLTDGALTGTTLDATGTSFDGLTGGTATVAQNYSIEDKIVHAVDNSAFGFVRVRAGHVYVTPNSFDAPATATADIQRAVNTAGNGDTVHIQSGSYFGSVNATAKMLTFSPGASPGQVTLNGNLTLDNNDTLVIEVNGTNPATQFDNFIVNGLVTLGGATLSTSGTIVTSGGSLVLMNNDGADPVSGTFNLLPESSVVTINGINFVLSYVGGTGNDVTLTQADSIIHLDGTGNLVIDDATAGVDDQITLQSDTANSRFIITDPNVFLTTNIAGATGNGTHTIFVPFGAVTGTQVNVNTFSGNDSLTVDFSLGNFSKAVNYDGGGQTTSDSITLTGGTFASVAHTFISASSGNVAITGNSLISYTALEPVIDNLGATNRSFTFTGGSETISLTDAAGANMTIDSTLGESVTFANPTTSLTISAGSGGDDINIASLDAAYNGSLTVTGDANNDNLTFGAGLPSLSALTANTETIAALPALTIGAGGLSLTATAGGLTVGGTLTVAGATTLLAGAGTIAVNANIIGGGNVTLTATDLSDSPTFAQDINVSAIVQSTGGSVLLQAGDDISINAGGSVAASTTVILTAAFGDGDNHGFLTIGGPLTGGGAVSATARDTIALGGNVTSTGAGVSLTSTNGSITHSAGAVSGGALSFSAPLGIGASAAEVQTSGTSIAFTTTTGSVFITEADDAAIGGSTGTGDITLVSTAGSFTLGLVSTSIAVGTVNIAAFNSILDGNVAANNIAALSAILSGGTGVGTPANKIDTTIFNLEGTGGTGGFNVSDTGTLNIGGISAIIGVSAAAGDIAITSGAALTISENIQTPGNVILTGTNGSITETGGAIITPLTLTTSSSGGQTLNSAGNQIGTFIATNTGAGSGISLQNNFGGFNISTVTSQTGGNIVINNTGSNATITGIIKSGNPNLGGDITVQSAGLLTVNNTVDSRNGTGGTLTLGGLLLLNSSPLVGFGDITLQGGAGPLTINAPISVSSPLVLQSTEDINILAKVETTSVTSDITVLADLDNDGDGGVYIGDNIFQGSLKAGRNLDVRGSDYLDSFAPLGNIGDSVIIQPNGANARLEAVGNVLVKINTAATTTSRIYLGGLVRSNTTGNVTFDNAVQLIDDSARALTHGIGNVIFLGEVDGGFDLRASTDSGVVLFNGAVGAVTRVGDVLVDTALDVTEIGGFTAASFTVGSATGTVELVGTVNTNGAGTNLSINTTTLLVHNTVTANAGNILWQADNLAVNGATSGTGTLTIQPVQVGRSIGLAGPGDLNLAQAEIDLFQDGFSQIIIGRTNGAGVVTTNGVTFIDPVSILSPAPGGLINVNGTIAGTGNASVMLQAPTINFNVANPTPAISTEADLIRVIGIVKLLTNTLIDTNFAGAGGNVTLDGTINGGFDLFVDAGNFAAGGTVAFNGSAGAPGGVSIGGTTPLSSLLVNGAAIVMHPQAITTGAQTYNATTSIDTYGGALRSKTSGAITLNGPVVLHDVLPIITSGLVGADVIFTNTVNTLSGNPGALRIDAGQLGNVTFNGNVGSAPLIKLQSLEVTRANNVVFNGSASVVNALKLDAAEIDFNGGVDSILAGTLTLQTDLLNQAVAVGGAADSGSNVLDITAGDVAALGEGIGSILIARTTGTAGITIAGGTTFTDPVTFRQSSRSGFINVLGNVTGLDNASLTFTGSATNLGGDLMTSGGAITTDYVNLTANVNVTSNGGAITFSNTLLDTGAGGHSLNIDSDAGNVSFLGPVGTSGPLLGAVGVASNGITQIKSSLVAKSFTTDATGTTLLQGTQVKATDPTGLGVHIADPITLNSSMRILTSGSAPITLDAGVNSKVGKTYSLTLQSSSGKVVVGGNIGDTAMLGTLRVRDNAAVTFTGTISAKAVNLRGLTVAVDTVTTSSTQTYNTQSIAFNGPISASKLTAKATTNIAVTEAFNIIGQATVKTARTADIALTNAANAFGLLSLVGHDATIVEAGDTHLVTTKLTGTLDLTSGGSVLQTARITANTLTIDAAGTISFIGAGQKINNLGAIAGQGNIIILGGGADLFLNGPITTTNGDVTIASNYRGTFHNIFNAGGPNVIQITGTGRYLLYAYRESVSNLDGLAFNFSEVGKIYPAAPDPGHNGNGIIYARA